MSGGCSCGWPLQDSTREVKSHKSAAERAGRLIQRPAAIERQVCAACGRQSVAVYRNGELVAGRG